MLIWVPPQQGRAKCVEGRLELAVRALTLLRSRKFARRLVRTAIPRSLRSHLLTCAGITGQDSPSACFGLDSTSVKVHPDGTGAAQPGWRIEATSARRSGDLVQRSGGGPAF